MLRHPRHTSHLAARLAATCTLLALLLPATDCTADDSLKQDAGNAGHAIGEAVHNIAQGAKKTGRAIGHDAVQVGHAIGSAAKEGAHQFRQAVDGKSSSQPPAPASAPAQK